MFDLRELTLMFLDPTDLIINNINKFLYRNKAITDVRKLVTEGYLKVNRASQDVSVSVEKVDL